MDDIRDILEFRPAVSLKTPTQHNGTVLNKPPFGRAHRNDWRRNVMATTISKHIRMDGKPWQRLERAASERDTSANRLLSELATQWLDNREWPPTEA